MQHVLCSGRYLYEARACVGAVERPRKTGEGGICKGLSEVCLGEHLVTPEGKLVHPIISDGRWELFSDVKVFNPVELLRKRQVAIFRVYGQPLQDREGRDLACPSGNKTSTFCGLFRQSMQTIALCVAPSDGVIFNPP